MQSADAHGSNRGRRDPSERVASHCPCFNVPRRWWWSVVGRLCRRQLQLPIDFLSPKPTLGRDFPSSRDGRQPGPKRPGHVPQKRRPSPPLDGSGQSQGTESILANRCGLEKLPRNSPRAAAFLKMGSPEQIPVGHLLRFSGSRLSTRRPGYSPG